MKQFFKRLKKWLPDPIPDPRNDKADLPVKIDEEEPHEKESKLDYTIEFIRLILSDFRDLIVIGFDTLAKVIAGFFAFVLGLIVLLLGAGFCLGCLFLFIWVIKRIWYAV